MMMWLLARLGRLTRYALAAALLVGTGFATAQPASANVPVSFAQVQTYPAELPSAIAVGQITPGGRSFVVVADGIKEEVSVYLAEPNGSLVSGGNHYVGGHPIALAIGDVNGDGNSDIVVSVAGSTSGIATLLGDGTGNFPTLKTSKMPGTQAPSSIALGDFNGDKKLDLVTADGNEGKIALALGNGDGTFDTAKAKLYSASSEPLSDIGTVKVADFNHDGKLDVASSTEGCGYENGSGEVRVLLGNGDGTLKEPPAGDVLDTCATRMSVADLNGDKNPDIVTNNFEQSSGGGYVASMLGKGDGTLGALSLSESTLAASSLTLPDLNGDGRPDAAIGGQNYSSGPEVQVLTGSGDGTFAAPQAFSLGLPRFAYITGITYGDLNNDGKQDLVVSYGEQDNPVGGIAVLLNTTGTAPPPPSPPPTPTPNSLPLVQLCSLIGPSTPNNPTATLLKKLDEKSSVLIGQIKGGHDPVSFDLYITAALEETQVCEANIALLSVTPFGFPTAKTEHDTFVTAPSPLSPQQRAFWYDPVRGWLYNSKARDWNLAAPGAQFSVSWSGAGFQAPKKSVNISLEDSKLLLEESPLAKFRGPLLETGLVQSLVGGQPLELITKLRPEASTGARLSLSIVKKYCYQQADMGLLQIIFNSRLSIALSEQIYLESLQDLNEASINVVKDIKGLHATAQQLEESIQELAKGISQACADGELAYARHLVLAVAVVAVSVAIPEAAGIVLAGRTVFVPAYAAAEARTQLATASSMSPEPPANMQLLPTRHARLSARLLRPAPLPASLTQAVEAIRPFRIGTSVGQLFVHGRLSPSQWVIVASGRLRSRAPHRVLLTLAGPGFLGTRLVQEKDGVAAINFRLPATMTPGRWTLAIMDEAGLRPAHHRVGGKLEMRLTSFTIAALKPHKRGRPRKHNHH
jgi:hypothetical protein